jgi:hypothetical protein
MEEAIRRYRDRYHAARRWAAGSYKVRHSEETQGRIFRMAEQLRGRDDLPSVGGFFSLLEALDEVVDAETSFDARPSAGSAAAAALVGYKLIFGRVAPVRDTDWPAGFELMDDGEVGLAALGLKRQGFDPIIIDGIDPAAYLWALFEMHERQAACAEVTRVGEHLAAQPRCIAAVRPDKRRRPSPGLVPAGASREVAGVAG